jgi:anti-anti-sigma regulatory factor
MAVEKWSDSIVVAHLGTDPQFSEEIDGILALDFSAVHFVNSSNIAGLLRVSHRIVQRNGKLLLCNVSKQIWTTFLITGLDKLFELGEDVPTALASIQLKKPPGNAANSPAK